jgi:hypothetical protein
MHPDIIKVYYSSMSAQVIVLKNSIKIYVTVAPTISKHVGAILM